jgi:hypothetical protein
MAATHFLDRAHESLARKSERAEQLADRAALIVEHDEQQMLNADILVFERLRLIFRLS